MRSFLGLIGLIIIASISFVAMNVNSDESLSARLITNCDGTQFIRTAPGELRVQTVARNLPGCIGSTVTGTTITPVTSTNTGTVTISSDVTNCSGLRVISYSDGSIKSFQVWANTAGCIVASYPHTVLTGSKVNLSNGPLLDLASTDIVNYRKKQLRDNGVRFANAVRSARIRREASKNSTTEAYLMKNDAVVVSGNSAGWTKVQWATLEVTNTSENTITANTAGKADGYTANRLLRFPNTSDLVTLGQADHAYWSDIAYTNVAKYVNIRSNPNYLSPIVTTIGNNYPLFVISTVDNWSLVRNESGSIRGYVRSDYLRIVKVQRVDTIAAVR